jgi:hypothetical protein
VTTPKAFAIMPEPFSIRRRRSLYAGAVLYTPEAFANCSPWLERSDNHGLTPIKIAN